MNLTPRKYSGNNANELCIYLEPHGGEDVRLRFTPCDIHQDSISLEFCVSGGRSPETLQALYRILEQSTTDTAHNGSIVVSRLSDEPHRVLSVHIDNSSGVIVAGEDTVKNTIISVPMSPLDELTKKVILSLGLAMGRDNETNPI